jgi:hypothetical protein
MKANVFALPIPDWFSEKREFSDGEVAFTLRRPHAGDVACGQEYCDQILMPRYVTGSELRPAVEFPVPGFNPSRTLFLTAAIAAQLQEADEEDTYTPEELVTLVVKKPHLWAVMSTWLGTQLGALGDPAGNAPGAPGD